jgi:hypothetical protein
MLIIVVIVFSDYYDKIMARITRMKMRMMMMMMMIIMIIYDEDKDLCLMRMLCYNIYMTSTHTCRRM